MKLVFSVLIFISLSLSVLAKEYTVTLTLKGYAYKKVYVLQLYGDKASVKDTIFTNADGKGSCTFSDKDNYGLYQFAFDDESLIDFIFNYENVSISTSYYNYGEDISIEESTENKIYYSFIEKQDRFSKKMDILTYTAENYPQDESFYSLTLKEFDQVSAQYTTFIDSMLQISNKTFAGKLIKAKRELVFSPEIQKHKRLELYKQQYFKYIDFSDTSLFYSDVLTHKIISYLSLFSSKYMATDQQELLFKNAIDTVLNKSVMYPSSYNFIVNYLINGFETMNMTNLVEYLADSYLKLNSCEDSKSKTTLERKVLFYKKLSAGSEAPAFSVTTLGGNVISNNSNQDKFTVLFYWSTHCPHCQESYPMLQRIANAIDKNKATIISISLDDNKNDVAAFLSENNYSNSIVVCDEKSWDGDIVQDYYVYATPTIIIIKDNKIVQKPIEIKQLIDFLGKNGIL